jgi:hypothetical protein
VDKSALEDDDPNRFKEAREGDYLMTPFQCPECHFFNIKRRLPVDGNHMDNLALVCIQRAILDSFWARERSTVNSNQLEGKKFLIMQRTLGFEVDCLPPRGPYPRRDKWGMGIACSMLLRSKSPGKNTATIQYKTLRKQRSFYSNFVPTSQGGGGDRHLLRMTEQEPLYLTPKPINFGLKDSCLDAIVGWETCGCQIELSVSMN